MVGGNSGESGSESGAGTEATETAVVGSATPTPTKAPEASAAPIESATAGGAGGKGYAAGVKMSPAGGEMVGVTGLVLLIGGAVVMGRL